MDTEKNIQINSANLPAVLSKTETEKQIQAPESISFFKKKETDILMLQHEQESMVERLFPTSPVAEIVAPKPILEMEAKKQATETRLTAMYEEKQQEIQSLIFQKQSFFEIKQKEIEKKEQTIKKQFFASFTDTKECVNQQSQSIVSEFQKIQNAIKNAEKEFGKQ